MAPTSACDTTLSSVTAPRGVHRLIVPTIVSPAARAVIGVMAETWGVVLNEDPSVRGRIAREPAEGDVLVHGVPDVFGRNVPPPPGWTVLRVADSALGLEVEAGTIQYGRPPTVTTAELSDRLQELWKPLCQQRSVRPILPEPGPFGLPFLAPGGIDLPDDVSATPVAWPGLPDLVVVHHRSLSAWAAYDGLIESEWT